MNVIHAADVPPTRWKNNGGFTRELLAWPSSDDWALRLSVADIEADGPFSSFPGIDRFFAVLSGEGVELNIDGAAAKLDARSLLHGFAGEAHTDCRLLGGATRDFNLMVRRERVQVEVRPCGETLAMADASWSGCFVASAARVMIDGHWRDVPALSLLWTTGPHAWQVQAERGWLISARIKE